MRLGATTARTGPKAATSAAAPSSSGPGEIRSTPPSARRTTVVRVPSASPPTLSGWSMTARSRREELHRHGEMVKLLDQLVKGLDQWQTIAGARSSRRAWPRASGRASGSCSCAPARLYQRAGDGARAGARARGAPGAHGAVRRTSISTARARPRSRAAPASPSRPSVSSSTSWCASGMLARRARPRRRRAQLRPLHRRRHRAAAGRDRRARRARAGARRRRSAR